MAISPAICFSQESFTHNSCNFHFQDQPTAVSWARIKGSIGLDGYSGVDKIVFNFLCKNNAGQNIYLKEKSTPFNGPWVFDLSVKNCTMDFRFSLNRSNGNVDLSTSKAQCSRMKPNQRTIEACQSAVVSSGKDSSYARGFCRNADRDVSFWNCVQRQTRQGRDVAYGRGFCR